MKDCAGPRQQQEEGCCFPGEAGAGCRCALAQSWVRGFISASLAPSQCPGAGQGVAVPPRPVPLLKGRNLPAGVCCRSRDALGCLGFVQSPYSCVTAPTAGCAAPEGVTGSWVLWMLQGKPSTLWGWDQMIFEVPSNPTQSILRFCDY